MCVCERERERGGERENERTIFYFILFFINEGNRISTIHFLHPVLGGKTKTKKQSETR